MPTSGHHIGADVTVWSLGGNTLIGSLKKATLTYNVTEQEGKAVNDTDDYPVGTGRGLEISGEMMLQGSALFMGSINASGQPVVAYSATTGAGTYAGTALLRQVDHTFEVDGIQMMNVRLKSRGAHTVTV